MRIALPLLIALAALPAIAAEVAPPLVAHQGRLLDNDDRPVSASVKMKFTLYKQAAPDGNLQDPTWWESAEATVQVKDGQYAILLGHPAAGTGAIPAAAFEGPGERWLGVTVEGAPLAPRLRFGSAPFALAANRAEEAEHAKRADSADVAKGLDCAGCVDGAKIAAGAVSDAQLAQGIDGAKLKGGTVGWDALAPLAATRHVANLDADSIGGRIPADFAAASHTHAAADIAGGTIPVSALPVHTHSGAEITSGKIGAQFLDLPDLSATYVAKTGDSTINGSLALSGTIAAKLKSENSQALDCTGKDGYIFYDATLTGFFGCAGGRVYRLLARDSVGLSQDKPGLDCNEILQRAGVASSGTYWIDPNGTTNGTADAYQVYCDMDTYGGGWTRCLASRYWTGSKPTGWTKNAWLATKWRTGSTYVLDRLHTDSNFGFFCSDLVARATEIWGEATYGSSTIGTAMKTDKMPLASGLFGGSGVVRATGAGNNAITRDNSTQGYYGASCQTQYTSNSNQGMAALCMSNASTYQAQHTGWTQGTYPTACPDSGNQPCTCQQGNYCGGSYADEQKTVMVLYVR